MVLLMGLAHERLNFAHTVEIFGHDDFACQEAKSLRLGGGIQRRHLHQAGSGERSRSTQPELNSPAIRPRISSSSPSSYATATPEPQTGPGQAESVVVRATTWTWSCGTRLPRAPTFSLSGWKRRVRTSLAWAISSMSAARSAGGRSWIARREARSGTRISQANG